MPCRLNPLKTILKPFWTLSEGKEDRYAVSTNALASHLVTSQASVSEMYKRLAEKEFIDYVPYRGGSLSPKGRQLASKSDSKAQVMGSVSS